MQWGDPLQVGWFLLHEISALPNEQASQFAKGESWRKYVCSRDPTEILHKQRKLGQALGWYLEYTLAVKIQINVLKIS